MISFLRQLPRRTSRYLPAGRHEAILALLLAAEIVLFHFMGPRFATRANAFDILRHSVEIGLLSVAITPVILMGAIDLSVGSLLGLCAIVFGKLWRDGGLPPAAAAVCSLALGAVAGALNGTLVTWLRMPSLIITLGTYSLFRGLAEAITHGVDTFTGFPRALLFLGQDEWLGAPAQLPIFLGVIVAMWLLVHRTTFGRTCRAIGYSPEGARFAGLPVGRHTLCAFTITGVISGVAAVIYTARVGQAKADAGTGYELFAITAVVLGGTSIFGGSGSVHGTILGVAAIAVLNNGLVHARYPREIAGMLTGALLIVALVAGALPKFLRERRRARDAVAAASHPSSSP